MKFLTHPAIVALGIVTLVTYPLTIPLFSNNHRAVYHLHGSASVLFLSVVLLTVILWVLIFGMLLLAERLGLLRRIVWAGLMSMLPWLALKTASVVLDWEVPHKISVSLFAAGLATFLGLIAFWKPRFQHRFDQAQTLAATILAFVAFNGLIDFGQLAWYDWQARALNDSIPLHARTATGAQPRIIWIVLDELSYRQVFEHRFPGLQLPAFDRLDHEATVFTHVVPAGLMTEYALPSMISGMTATKVRASPDGRELFLGASNADGQTHYRLFDQHQTVFQDALDHGYSTAVAGWYNPYCRILPQVLDQCYWTNHYTEAGGISGDSIAENLIAPFRSVITSARHYFRWNRHEPIVTARDTEIHLRDYQDLFAAADRLLNDSSADFLYLHMPVPHPVGIYNRHTGQLSSDPATYAASYLDNLALADAYLTHVRTELEQRGEWDSATVLITGDHSWRTTQIYASNPGLFQEELLASDGGKFDDRPGYILKLANQQQPAHIDAPFQAVRTRALLDAIMDHSIYSAQDLALWVNAPHDVRPKQ